MNTENYELAHFTNNLLIAKDSDVTDNESDNEYHRKVPEPLRKRRSGSRITYTECSAYCLL